MKDLTGLKKETNGSPSKTRIEFATTIFVRECLRQFMRLHPDTKPSDLPMKALCEYPIREQQALMNAIEKAVEAASGMDDTYRTFIEQKLTAAQQKS